MLRTLSKAKRALKAVRDRTIARNASARWQHLENGLLVLSYHRVLPRHFAELDVTEPGMYVFEDTFEMHLRVLLEHFEPVHLLDWIRARKQSSNLPSLAFAVTFDDGWRDNFEYAYPMLQKAGVPATVFAVSALVGTNHSFWPERLARRVKQEYLAENGYSNWIAELVEQAGIGTSAPGNESMSMIIAAAKTRSDDYIVQQLDALDAERAIASSCDVPDLLDWAELRQMLASGLVRVGSHTRHHVRMRDELDERVLSDELIQSRRDLEENLNCEAAAFCYPNGDRTAASAQIVKAAYEAACTTQIGWNDVHTDEHEVRRVMLHEDTSASRAAFLARIASAASRGPSPSG